MAGEQLIPRDKNAVVVTYYEIIYLIREAGTHEIYKDET